MSSDIGAEEVRPLIRRAFEADLVDTFVVGADILDKPFSSTAAVAALTIG